jgi:hypothetical protein
MNPENVISTTTKNGNQEFGIFELFELRAGTVSRI